VDGTGSQLFPVTDFSISRVEASGSVSYLVVRIQIMKFRQIAICASKTRSV
jgi:hypothetical protein